jgi:uncharacterized protein YndB with AHSA1/START domain
MTQRIHIAPVSKRIIVSAAPARAFEIFTEGMTRWWPREHSINKSPIREIVIEPRVGGRWMERGEDGIECLWGKVLAWEPPTRIVLAWQITAQWQYDPSLVTEVEVRFTPKDSATLVELEHRLDGYGDAAAKMRELFDGPQAWQATLDRFAGSAS